MKFIRNTVLATTLLTAAVNAGVENESAATDVKAAPVVVAVEDDVSPEKIADKNSKGQSFREVKQEVEAHFGMSLWKISLLQGVVSIGFGALWVALGLL